MRGARKQAIASDGLSHRCEHCKFNLTGRLDICRICGDAYKEGFIKGSKWAEKKIKEEHHEDNRE